MTSHDRILRFLRECGYSPTVRDIGLAVGLRSPSTVHSHLVALEQAGVIERIGATRRIRIKEAA